MRWAGLALVAVCLAVFGAGLGRVGLLDEREARDAVVARELVDRRELITPTLGSEAHFEKPTAGYALEVAGNLLVPDSPLASRLLRAGIAILLVLFVASVGAEMLGPRAGLCAAGALATMLAMPLAARTDGTQLLSTLLGWVGCAGLADATFGRRAGRDARLMVAYTALGGALVVGGPLAGLWPLAGAALYLKLVGNSSRWKDLRPLPGIAIMIGIALPWYAAMFERYGATFAVHMPWFPYGTEPRDAWYAGLLRALGFLVMGALPWSTLLPGAALHAATWWPRAQRRRPALGSAEAGMNIAEAAREHREESAAHFFLASLVAALAPIVLYPRAPLPAVLPALPAVALLCGRLLAHLFESPARVAGHVRYGATMLAIVGSAGSILLALLATRIREAAPDLRLLATLALVTAWAPFLASFIGRPRVGAVLFLLPVAIGMPVIAMRVLPAMESYVNTRAVARAMQDQSPEGTPLVMMEPVPASLRFYLERSIIPSDSLSRDLPAIDTWDGYVYLAFRPSRERATLRSVARPLDVVLRTPSLVLARVRTQQKR